MLRAASAAPPLTLCPGLCGLDEVGRGALAGPLVAAAVVLPEGFTHPLLRDSKQLTERQREELEPVIRAAALALEVVALPAGEIDRLGMGRANRHAFELLIERVAAPLHLGDGNLRLGARPSYRAVVKGDRTVPAISAASIVAKVFRDHLMVSLDPLFPAYGFGSNKGYGSLAHRAAIRLHGTCPEHRLSFLQALTSQLFPATEA